MWCLFHSSRLELPVSENACFMALDLPPLFPDLFLMCLFLPSRGLKSLPTKSVIFNFFRKSELPTTSYNVEFKLVCHTD